MATLELICDDCGEPLEIVRHSQRGVGVDPCIKCKRDEREKGREEGYNEGLADGSSQ